MPEQDPKLEAYNFAVWHSDKELAEDLRKNYLNSEVFANPKLNQVYLTGVFKNTFHYSDRNPAAALVVSAYINGEALPLALRESLFWRLISGSQLKEIMAEYGARTFAEFRSAIQAHATFPETDKEIGALFLRHFPFVLLSAYDILTDVAICTALLRSETDKKAVDRLLKLILRRNLAKLERDIKRMIGTRKRGGSKRKLEKNKQLSLYVRYDELLKTCKAIKKLYRGMFETFDKNRRSYKRDEWRKFWLSYATQIYAYDPEFLALFSEIDNPSASDVAYQWLSMEIGHAPSYVKRLVMKSRPRKSDSHLH